MPVLPLDSKMHKVWLRCLKVLKQQEILNAVTEGHKGQTKVKPMHFQVKMYGKKLRFMSLEANSE